MAQVIQLSGPSVGAQTVPQPEQSIQARPDAFAGNVLGEAQQQLGQDFQKTSDQLHAAAIQYQQINAKQAADEASVKATAALDQMGLDFRENNTGMAAAQNYGKFQGDIEAKRQEFASSLSPMAKIEFEAATRRYAANVLSNTASFAASQRKEAVVKTFEAVINQNLALGIADPTKTNDAAAAIGKQVAALADPAVLGWTKEQAQEYTREKLGSLFQGQIKIAIDQGDIPAAQKLYEDHKDSMSAAQLESVAGALRSGSNAFAADSFADSFLKGGSFTSPRTNGPWNQGSGLIRNNPQAVLSELAGGSAIVSSGERSAVHNAAVGGSATSEHLTNDAWDFNVHGMAPGAAAANLAASLNQRGLAFDQIEVASDHVHVGFGPKNRGEIIGANGKSLTTAAGPVAMGGVKIAPGMDPDLVEAQGGLALLDAAQRAFPTNPQLQEMAVAKTQRKLSLITGAMRAQNNVTYSNLGKAILDGDIKDEASLVQAYPGAASDFASLPAKYQFALKSDLQRNDRDMTDPARQALYTTVMGEAAAAKSGQDNKFISEDISKMDLPVSVKLSLMKEQQDIIHKKAAVTAVDSLAGKTINSIEGKAAMAGLQIALKSDDYYHLYGAIQSGIQDYQAQHAGAAPTQKDLNAILAAATKTTGEKKFLWFSYGGKQSFQVPEAAVAAFHDAGITNEADISRIYHNTPALQKKYGVQ